MTRQKLDYAPAVTAHAGLTRQDSPVHVPGARRMRRVGGLSMHQRIRRRMDRLGGTYVEARVEAGRIDEFRVPGAWELPLAADRLAARGVYDAIVALGCVIRGETPHFDFIAAEAASGLQLAAHETGVPVSFGVLTCDTREQAEARADGSKRDQGRLAAEAVLRSALVLRKLAA